MPVVYRNTQIAMPILLPLDILIVVMIYLGITKNTYSFFTLAALFAVLEALFAWLTTIGTESTLEIRFGIGLIRKRFRLSDILSVQPYRTTFLQGWGIHLSTDGTVYNVSGFDAVLLRLRNGKQVILGTNDRERLLSYIRQYAGLQPTDAHTPFH